MLRTLLNRDQVAEHAASALAALQAAAVPPELEVHARDIATSLQAIGALKRGDAQAASERSAYINSNPHVSLLQALLEETAHTGKYAGLQDDHDSRQPTTPFVAAALPDEARTSLQTHDVPMAHCRDETTSEDFAWWDINWLGVVDEMLRVWQKRIHYQLAASPPAPFQPAPNARVILLSDWGNGSDVAVEVATTIREQWLETAGERECHLVHLGDVYYAGTPWEANNWFLKNWPIRPEDVDAQRPWHSWALTGNHDMYSAAEGVDVILADPRFSHQRTIEGAATTQFLLRTEHLQILGLDSSWQFHIFDPCNLTGRLGAAQVAWAAEEAARRPNTVLLTHHQAVSRDKPFPKSLTLKPLLSEAASILAASHNTAWFWGHDHRCITYGAPERTERLHYAACIGHGAMPEAVATPPARLAPSEWELDQAQPADAAGDIWRTSGFAVLDLAPSQIEVTYVNQDGTPSRGQVDHIPLSPP